MGNSSSSSVGVVFCGDLFWGFVLDLVFRLGGGYILVFFLFLDRG